MTMALCQSLRDRDVSVFVPISVSVSEVEIGRYVLTTFGTISREEVANKSRCQYLSRLCH